MVKQSMKYQVKTCEFHKEGFERRTSLFKQHKCSCQPIPELVVQILGNHDPGEVWILKISSNGEHLASIDDNNKMLIWKIDPNLCQITLSDTYKSKKK